LSRVVIWSPAYAPELLGIPPLVTQAAEWLAGHGHDVHVVAPMPNNPTRVIYPAYRGRLWLTERRGDVTVHRGWLRVRSAESFLDKVLWELTYVPVSAPFVLRRLRSTDVLVCIVPSLLATIAGAAFARAARGRSGAPRLVLWVQDLVVEAAAVVRDMSAAKRRVLAEVRRGEMFAARAADQIVICSPGFGSYFEERGVRTPITTVLNWVDVQAFDPTARRGSGPTRFVYGGNLGYTQGLETLIDAAGLVGPDVHVEIVGDGNAAESVRQRAEGMPNVDVRPSVDWNTFPRLLASADVLVLIQRRVAAGANFPSKTAPYLASGRPVLASLDGATAVADVLRESGGSLLVAPEDPVALAGAMRRLHEDAALRSELADRGRRYAVAELSREALLPRLERAFLDGLSASGPKVHSAQ
jgi:colanic acid biosynthesis glycosyl transferase WcaI